MCITFMKHECHVVVVTGACKPERNSVLNEFWHARGRVPRCSVACLSWAPSPLGCCCETDRAAAQCGRQSCALSLTINIHNQSLQTRSSQTFISRSTIIERMSKSNLQQEAKMADFQTNRDNESMNPAALSVQGGEDPARPVEVSDSKVDSPTAEPLCNKEVRITFLQPTQNTTSKLHQDGLMPTAERATEFIVETVKEGAKSVASVVSNIATAIVDKVEKAADDQKGSALGPYSDHATTAPSDMDPVGEAVLLGLDMNGDGEIRRG